MNVNDGRDMDQIPRIILEDIHELIYAVEVSGDSLQGKVLFVGRAVERLVGYSPDDFMQDPGLWLRNVHPDDLEELKKSTEQLVLTKKPVIRVFRFRHKRTGEFLWIEDRVSPQVDEHGSLKGYIGIAEDITQRRQHEEATRRGSIIFEEFFESVPDAVVIVDVRGCIVEMNARTTTLFGYTFDELVGQSVEILMPERFRQRHIEHRTEYAAHPQAHVMGSGKELFARRKDGNEFPVDIAMGPFRTGGSTLILCAIRDVSERKRLEQEMRHLSAAVEQTADCVIIGDREGTVQYVNPAFEGETGYTREEVVGKTLRVLKSGVHDVAFFGSLRKTILSGRVFRAVFVSRKKDGELIHEQTTITPIVDAQGNITHFVSTAKNITENVRAEQALRESEERFRDLFESTHDLIQAVTPDGRFLYVNRAWREALGYTEKEVARLTLHQVIHAESLAKCGAAMQQLLAGEKTDRIETVFVTKQGKSINVEGGIYCKYEQGSPVSISCILRDITDRKEAEETLRASEKHFRDILEEARFLVVILNLEGKIVFTNDYLLELTGWQSSEVLGQDWFKKLVPQRSRKDVMSAFLSGIKTGVFPVHNVSEIVTRRRKLRVIAWNDIILHDAEGNVVAVTKIGGDITERKRAEDQLKVLHQRLHLLATKLETSREEERIRIAREVHDVLGQELTGLSFDVSSVERTLLQTTKGYPLPSLINKVKSISSRLQSTIQEVQHIATELRPDAVEARGLHKLLRSYAEEFQTRTSIHCKLNITPRIVDLDKERSTAIFRIFQESLTNVARHARANEVNVWLRKKGDCMVLSVRDNGRGIRKNEVADNRSLGLMGMSERALLFGGQVRIHGSEGTGTSIIVRIPCADPGTT